MKNSLSNDVSISTITEDKVTDYGNITLTTSQELLEQIPVESCNFIPYAVYNNENDDLTAYFYDENYFAIPLNQNITLFKNLDNDQIVGCKIHSIKNMMNYQY